MSDRAVIEFEIDDVDSVFLDAETGLVKILFDAKAKHDIAISLSAKAVARLEVWLAEVREEQRHRSKPQ